MSYSSWALGRSHSMKRSAFFVAVVAALLYATVGAQQQQTTTTSGQRQGRAGGQQAASNGPHVYIRAGLKSHGPGQHDYPQFLADWSKVLTDRGAVVDGSLHFPKASELEDAGGMTPEEKTTLENYLKRGGGLVSFHDTLCGPDPAYYATIVGGAKKHGETIFTLEADIPYTIVDKKNLI